MAIKLGYCWTLKYLPCCFWFTELCPTLCDSMNCSLPGSSVHRISQTRILVWVAILFSRGPSQLRDWAWTSCLAQEFFTTEPPELTNKKVLHLAMMEQLVPKFPMHCKQSFKWTICIMKPFLGIVNRPVQSCDHMSKETGDEPYVWSRFCPRKLNGPYCRKRDSKQSMTV